MKRILIVSDDEGMVKLVSDVLSLSGNNRIVAAAAYECVEEEIKTSKIIIDVVILDFAVSFEAAVHTRISALLNFLDQTSSNYRVVAMFDDRREEKAADGFRVDRKIKKPGVNALREI